MDADALAIYIIRPLVTIVSSMQGKQVFVFWEEKFQLPVPY